MSPFLITLVDLTVTSGSIVDSILIVLVKFVITGFGNPDSGYWISCGGGNMLVTLILLLLREVS